MTTASGPPNLHLELSAPFPIEAIGWKPQAVKGNRALAVAYIDSRDVMGRLDRVVGPENWWATYDLLGNGERVVCHLTILVDGRAVTKTDVGGESDQPDGADRLKAAFSDSLKRAGVQWGVGRYLYSLPAVWCDIDDRKQITTPPQLPAWALPPREKAAPRPAPAGGRHAAPPAATAGADLGDRVRAESARTGWGWTACTTWLNAAHPGEPVPYGKATRMPDIEPDRLAQLLRHLERLPDAKTEG